MEKSKGKIEIVIRKDGVSARLENTDNASVAVAICAGVHSICKEYGIPIDFICTALRIGNIIDK